MAGNVLQSSHAFALGKWQAKSGGGALCSCYPWHHVKCDTCCPARLNLLGSAPKNQRIAAFEANHTFALPREAHHQGIDIFLLAGRAESGFADQHLRTGILTVIPDTAARIEMTASVGAEAVDGIEIERRGPEILDRLRIRLLVAERRQIERDVVVDELSEIGESGRNLGVVTRRIAGSGATVLSENRPLSAVASAMDKPVAEIENALTRAIVRMLTVREKREKPFRDEKVLASWNGLTIGALADASIALGEPSLLGAAYSEPTVNARGFLLRS